MRLAQQVTIDPYLRMPLHMQVKAGLVDLIDAGELCGELPAPCVLARELRIYAGSIRRAYDELVEVGLFKLEGLGYSVSGAAARNRSASAASQSEDTPSEPDRENGEIEPPQ